jgi:hypothetical protein
MFKCPDGIAASSNAETFFQLCLVLLHESVLRMGVIMVGLNRQTQP